MNVLSEYVVSLGMSSSEHEIAYFFFSSENLAWHYCTQVPKQILLSIKEQVSPDAVLVRDHNAPLLPVNRHPEKLGKIC
jgi:hypothetical protein